MGVLGAYTPPKQVSPSMLSFIAAVDILEGLAVAIDTTTGEATFSNVGVTPFFPVIGIAANSARAGDTVFVQINGVIKIPRNGGGTILVGNAVGDETGTGVLADITALFGGANGSELGRIPTVGFLLAQDATSNTVLVFPYNIVAAIASGTGAAVIANADTSVDIFATPLRVNGSPLASPNFADAEVPSGAIDGVNHVFTLAHVPNPTGSLLVFIRNNAGPLAQTAVPAIPGVHFSLTGTTIDFNGGTNPLGPPPAGGGIRFQVWYRF